ncbi:flagellar export protein FliJ [Clostridium omnivorum]|uniref:Flagellar FliJ protein n=1 Tax=Clostridium omnivorum TaxID=1604902 RepID=A0ABQ5NAQ7_9CLOT|nr:flagellar export protein FliJ [Clostridium sp. E14]GLC32353.1 flagellar protein FliJ [Clostridium sp. E14]
MEGYKFRLQKLLDIRLDKEEESKRNFKEAQRNKTLTEQKLLDLKEKQNKYTLGSSKETIVEQKIRRAFLDSVIRSIDEVSIDLNKKNQILEEKRVELKQKQIERKTVETLKDKQLKAFIKEQQLIEQKTNDEFALYGFIRNHEGR